MNKIVFVTSFYRFDDRSYADDILKRFEILAKYIPLYVFCSKQDTHFFNSFHNVTVHEKEYDEYETYKLLCDTEKLPENRNFQKDTKEFMILMNMKTECLYLAKQSLETKKSDFNSFESDFFVWLDAGISKIFQNPDYTLYHFYDKILEELLPEKILIPGCWDFSPIFELLHSQIIWRYCGGFFCVPDKYVNEFYEKVLEGCKEIKERTGKAIWEVNIWAFIEDKLPIQWKKGDHNESIFSF